MKIFKFIRYLFIILLFLQFIAHSYVNISIDKFFIDITNIIAIILIISLLIEKSIFSVILLLYAVAICILNFSPMFMSEKMAEKIYYDIFLGLELSSYIRNNIVNKYWIVNPIMNLSFYFAGYIIFLEIPFRLYKRKLFPFNKKS
ncbi:hypothetical protein [Chryseobacterium sp. AG844]|uniref:hypothetical protein n=1 Tax=Chryseobacterium sp. AG844 TaxID=2183998 RepID=UPI000D7181A2|nr:hypothetical protein [Chryseobacterium sp. AG844]PWW30924.1 hypothetical protein DEU40_101351 [Chryseobacterium sp. AG844]